MTKDEALKLALEALEPEPYLATWYIQECVVPAAITAIKASLEAKDEKANDELRRLHDLLGKANALARIRANKIDELEQRLTKTEAQLGEAVWNYGELKREQLANQQKTSGSPINTSTALEAKDEPVAWMDASRFEELRNGFTVMTTLTKKKAFFDDVAIYATPPQRTWVGLTDEHKEGLICMTDPNPEPHHLRELIDVVEFQLKEKNT